MPETDHRSQQRADGSSLWMPLKRLVESHRRLFYAVIVNSFPILKDEVDDILSQSVMNACKSNKFNGDVHDIISLRKYFAGIVRNTTFTYARNYKKSIGDQIGDDLLESLAVVEDGDLDDKNSDAFVAIDERTRLRLKVCEFLETLSEDNRKILIRKVTADGGKYSRALAEELGTSENNIRKRAERLLDQLKHYLEEN